MAGCRVRNHAEIRRTVFAGAFIAVVLLEDLLAAFFGFNC